MTVIVAHRDGDRVWMGSDAGLTAGWEQTLTRIPKVFRRGPLLIGISGGLEVMANLRYEAEIPDPPKRGLDRWAMLDLAPAFRAAARPGTMKVMEGQSRIDGAAVVAVRDRTFVLWGDGSVSTYRTDFHALGSGQEAARGALYALAGTDLSPRRRVELALRASASTYAQICGPFTIMEGRP